MKFLSPEAAVYLYKSTIRSYLEYCCHVWAGAPGCYVELLDKLQKRICRTVGPSLAASLEPLAHRQNVTSLGLSTGITLVDVLENWLNWCYFLFLEGGLLVIVIDCIIFLSPFLDVTRMSMSTVPDTARIWNSLTSFNFRFSLKRFPVCCNLFVLLFPVTPCLVVAVQPCM